MRHIKIIWTTWKMHLWGYPNKMVWWSIFSCFDFESQDKCVLSGQNVYRCSWRSYFLYLVEYLLKIAAPIHTNWSIYFVDVIVVLIEFHKVRSSIEKSMFTFDQLIFVENFLLDGFEKKCVWIWHIVDGLLFTYQAKKFVNVVDMNLNVCNLQLLIINKKE